MNTPSPIPEVRIYRVRYWRMLIGGLVATQILIGAYLLVAGVFEAIRGASDSDWVAFFIMAALMSANCVALMLPTVLLLVFLLPVKVSAESFACSNAFGKMIAVPWGAIIGVRSLPIPGFEYLLIRCSGKRPKLWLLLALRRFPEFVEDVGRCAGHDHVLYQALWPRVEQK